MPRASRDRAWFVAVLCTGMSCWACAVASADPGTGTGTGGTSMPKLIAPSAAVDGYGVPGTRAVLVAATALVGSVVPVRGTFPGAARKRVILQRLDPRRGWRNVARTRVRSTERFVAQWRADRSGRIGLRVVIPRRADAAAAAPVANVNVYRPALATYFGPGLYGNPTYCGQILTPLLFGVAHRRLPCGTQIAILHDEREIIVPVVDRGPFNEPYDWDLTQATADALGFKASGPIGYVRLRPAQK